MQDLDWYYNQLKTHTLEPLDTGSIKSFYLRQRPGHRLMSTLLIFSPEGIIITGDLRPAGSGVIAPGYGLDWFSGPLQPRYLAEKFLKERWVKESFIRWVQEYIRDGIKARSLDIERRTWQVGSYSITYQNCTEGRALRHLITRYQDNLETPEQTYDALPSFRDDGHWHCPFDSEFLSPGYDYDPAELGWLVAIQRRFSELVREVSYA